MWPFRRKKDKTTKRQMVERVVTGVIIGAAISSIIGKAMLDKHDTEDEEDGEKK